MISDKHSDQARVNGANSQGPVTPEGKQASSQNATKHGLTAATLHISPEEQKAFDQLRAQFLTDLRPIGAMEKFLTDELIHSAWKQQKARLSEAALLQSNGGLDPLLSDDPDLVKKAERFRRYTNQITRAFHKATTQLAYLQNNRIYCEQYGGKLVPANMPRLADAPGFSKRTERSLRNSYHDAVAKGKDEAKHFEFVVKQAQEFLKPDAPKAA